MLKYVVVILWRKKGAAANFYAFCISGCNRVEDLIALCRVPSCVLVAQNASSHALTDASERPQNIISWPPAQIFHPLLSEHYQQQLIA